MTVKQFVSDSLVGVAIGLVVAMVVLILTACSPYCYSVGSVDKDTITQRAATPAECPTGGTVVVINGSISPANIICNGSNGAVGPQGPNGNDGAVGAPGSNGNDGHDGATGPQGPKGDQGDPGQDLTPISFVQLCQSSVGSYPSVFPEIAMCIDHKLYGVYSANGGFLVFMPPGAYSSNGINSSCSFTVLQNCVIQP